MDGQCFHRSCQNSPWETGLNSEGEFKQLLDQATHQQTEAITPHLTEITLLFKLGIEVPNERRQQCTGNRHRPEGQMWNRAQSLRMVSFLLASNYLKALSFPAMVNIAHSF